MPEHQFQPTETYKGVAIYLYQDEGMGPGEYGAMFEWHGRMIKALVEDWQRPTRKNILSSAHSGIDLIKQVEGMGMRGPDGTLNAEG